jgi:hypothetical protein
LVQSAITPNPCAFIELRLIRSANAKQTHPFRKCACPVNGTRGQNHSRSCHNDALQKQGYSVLTPISLLLFS